MNRKNKKRLTLSALALVLTIAGIVVFSKNTPNYPTKLIKINHPPKINSHDLSIKGNFVCHTLVEKNLSLTHEKAKKESIILKNALTLAPKPTKTTQISQSPIKIILDGNYLLALVDKHTSLDQYYPADLVSLSSVGYAHMQLRREASENLERLNTSAKSQNINLVILSAFRSYETQRNLFNNYAKKYGEIQANTFSAKPGHSEHQLGTTVDFGSPLQNDTNLKTSFENTPEFHWLFENGHKFGFALSYPKNSQSITGYIYEPWHWRYIGIDSAQEWKSSGLVLSQFLAQKPQYYR